MEETQDDIIDPTKIMDGLSNEIANLVEALEQAQTTEEKRMLSEVIKNLSDSFSTFFNVINEMAVFPEEDDNESSVF